MRVVDLIKSVEPSQDSRVRNKDEGHGGDGQRKTWRGSRGQRQGRRRQPGRERLVRTKDQRGVRPYRDPAGRQGSGRGPEQWAGCLSERTVTWWDAHVPSRVGSEKEEGKAGSVGHIFSFQDGVDLEFVEIPKGQR